MKWVRAVGAVVLGYFFSQGLNGVFVYYIYVMDGAPATQVLVPITVVAFLVIGLITGVIVARVGGGLGLNSVRIAAGAIALVTMGNIVVDVAAEPLWHKLVVLIVMAPAVVWSGSHDARREPVPE